jgi:hypothetical protein
LNNKQVKPKVKKTRSVSKVKSLYDEADIPMLSEEEEREVIASVVQRQDFYAAKTFSDFWE